MKYLKTVDDYLDDYLHKLDEAFDNPLPITWTSSGNFIYGYFKIGEKEYQIEMLKDLHERYPKKSAESIRKLQEAAVKNENMFDEIMEASKYCSLGEITKSLFEVGGQYRRNM